VRRFLLPALIALALAAPNTARAQDDERYGLLQQLAYTIAVGGLLPAGQEGEGLDPGFHARAVILRESGSGLSLGGGLEWSRSRDPLQTNFITLGAIAHISPQDYTGAYLRLGLGAYALSYDPKDAGIARPESIVRPGGSFGAGLQAFQTSRFGFGGSAVYHGIMLQRSDALSYLTVSLDLTWRPYSF
jgi:hypothetical protein